MPAKRDKTYRVLQIECPAPEASKSCLPLLSPPPSDLKQTSESAHTHEAKPTYLENLHIHISNAHPHMQGNDLPFMRSLETLVRFLPPDNKQDLRRWNVPFALYEAPEPLRPS